MIFSSINQHRHQWPVRLQCRALGVLEMQNRKRDLAAALLNDSPEASAAFTADDIDFLFQEFK